MTLCSGVERPVSFQTSRASVSRDTTWPSWRIKYSSSSNSRTVRSTLSPPRVTFLLRRSIVRSPTAKLAKICPSNIFDDRRVLVRILADARHGFVDALQELVAEARLLR